MCTYMRMYAYVYICVYVCSGLSIPPQIHRVVLASRSSECDFWEVTSPVCKMLIMVTPASGDLCEDGWHLVKNNDLSIPHPLLSSPAFLIFPVALRMECSCPHRNVSS